MSLAICTTNKGKRAEFERILGVSLEAVDLELEEIQSLDTAAVCRAKASQAFRLLGRPVLVDDTGFELPSLGGFPGALVTWVLATGEVGLLYRMLPVGADAAAVAVTCIGLADDDGVQVFTGRCEGSVVPEPRGTNGFGFDTVFVPSGERLTFAEITDEAKDSISPRGRALRSLVEYLGNKRGRRGETS